ncbi:MAG: DUF421 domain-containing protein [Cytophagaceae bacterium]|nr:DUF421 domain-containing protein [Cytophagaceae bacterium]
MKDYQFGDWSRLLINDFPGIYLLEVFGRTVFMFFLIFAALRSTGKRTVQQLSAFELVLILGLGSAAGDPMFYHDVGLLPALLVFVVVILSYRAMTYLASRSARLGNLIEGSWVCLIDDGVFSIENFKKEDLGQDEFFMELRLRGVEHIGQVRKAYIETNGGISLYFYEDEHLKPGLPILPDLFLKKFTSKTINDV